MNVTTSKTVLFACTFLCGAVAKIYDDLTDNYRLHQFSNPTLLEVLKGTFMLTFTFTSIFNPLWFAMLCIFNYLSMFVEPLSYELTYERSLYITSSLLFLFINYDKLFEQMNELYSSTREGIVFLIFFISTIVFENILRKIVLLPGVPQWVRTHCNIKRETSFFKLAETVYAIVSLHIYMYYINNTVSKLYMIWIYGYAIIRLFTQIYSLFVYKPKSFPLDETQYKQPISKESVIKDETEELKDETHENITS
jgi:hypothetical protein